MSGVVAALVLPVEFSTKSPTGCFRGSGGRLSLFGGIRQAATPV